MQPYFHDLRARRGTRHSQWPVGAVFLENEKPQSEKLAEQRDVRSVHVLFQSYDVESPRGNYNGSLQLHGFRPIDRNS